MANGSTRRAVHTVEHAELVFAEPVRFERYVADGLMTDSPAPAAQASIRFDALQADAYRRSESLTLIEEMAEKWKP